MGRATYDSIGRPLPGRTTDRAHPRPGLVGCDGVLVGRPRWTRRWPLAADLPGEVMVSGGAAVYAAALPLAAAQILTEVHLSPEGDTSYPDWDRSEWVEKQRVPGPGLEWVWWERA